MKTIIFLSVFLLVLFQLSSSVTVMEGDFKFSLEAVKALEALMTAEDAPAELELRLVEAKALAVCSNPALPKVFKPLCLRKDAATSLARLVLVARSDACELCESVACFGC